MRYGGTLLDGTVLCHESLGGETWYLVDLKKDDSTMESFFGPEVVVVVEPGVLKADIYPVVPEPSALMGWSFLGPAGVVAGAFAWRRRRLNKQ